MLTFKHALTGCAAGLLGAAAMRAIVKGWEFRHTGHPEHAPFGLDREADINGALLLWHPLAASRALSEEDAARLGAVLHYAFGSAGGLGFLLLPAWARKGYGIPYGLAMWAVADLAAVSASGIQDPATKTFDSHLVAVLAHFAYGAAAYAVLETTGVKR